MKIEAIPRIQIAIQIKNKTSTKVKPDKSTLQTES
jgi:hypothetical protein